MTGELQLDRLSVDVRGRTLLHPICARMAPGAITAIVGPNGAGKSTLLRAAAALVPANGAAKVDGKAVAALNPIDRARTISFLPQSHEFAWSIPVRAMVSLGQYAFGAGMKSGEAEAAAADAAMASLGIIDLAEQPVDQLSGGERALAALARILAASTPILLLDEPVAALDVARQYAVLEHLARLASEERNVIVVLHDLALVAQFADRILWLDGGKLIAASDASRASIDHYCETVFGRPMFWSTGTEPVPFFRR